MITRTILVVDDERAQRELMRFILHSGGYSVLESSDYDDALAIQEWHLGEIDLLLVDLSLPGANGYELSKAMRAREPHLKVLFVSGSVGAELLKFLDKPVPGEHFLQKPFQPCELLERLNAILGHVNASAGSA